MFQPLALFILWLKDLRRLLPAAILVLASGCATADPTVFSESPRLRVLPDQVSATPATAIQFQGALDGNVIPADQITWSVSDTSLGQVSESGLLATTPCFRTGHLAVHAVLRRDPTKRATAQVAIVVPAFAWVGIQSIHRAEDHQPVDLAQVSGTVDVTVFAAALACHNLVGLQLRVTGPTRDTLLPAILFDPPLSTRTTGFFTWETAATVNGVRIFPDGDYQLRAIRQEIPALSVESYPISLRVRSQ